MDICKVWLTCSLSPAEPWKLDVHHKHCVAVDIVGLRIFAHSKPVKLTCTWQHINVAFNIVQPDMQKLSFML